MYIYICIYMYISCVPLASGTSAARRRACSCSWGDSKSPRPPTLRLGEKTTDTPIKIRVHPSFLLVNPVYAMNTYMFKVNAFTKQAKYEKNAVLFSSFRMFNM